MRKQEFIAVLRKKLSALPRRDAEERIAFYSEMIDDRIEEGLLEEEAVSAVGSVDEIAEQILKETPIKKETAEKKSAGGWKVLFLVLGSPIWLSLIVAVVAVAVSLYAVVWAVAVSLWAVVWAVAVSLWAVFVSLVAVGAVGPIMGIVHLCMGHGTAGFVALGAGLVCAGLAVFAYSGCLATTKATLLLTKTCGSKLVAYGRRTHNG